MTDLRKAAEMALEALNSKYIVNCGAWMLQQDQAAEALRQALYVDKVYMSEKHVHKSDKAIQKREWVGLTNVEIQQIRESFSDRIGCNAFVEALSQKLKEKNT
jgi:hypothetical protein